MKKGIITIDHVKIKRIIKEYCEQFYAHQFDNLDEMDPKRQNSLQGIICQNSHKEDMI